MSKDIPLSAELLHGRPVSCEARREGDEFACPCGKRWDVDDPDPPTCHRARHIFTPTPATLAARAEIVRPAIPVKPQRLPTPDSLTDGVVDQMLIAYAANLSMLLGAGWETASVGLGHRIAMRAACRALLDSLDG